MQKLYFNVSTGLKSVLGRDLITDDEVAIFELVKNSFDADARQVYIFFDEDRIVIADNGTGMSRKDLNKKWLFVAYSEKRGGNEPDYRETIVDRKHYAGSKGIGRFSSDRLGSKIVLQTRAKAAKATEPIHQLEIDWNLFEKNDKAQFESIPATYSGNRTKFNLPPGIPYRKSGTIIDVRSLRHPWSRANITRLKSGLAKLINPFGSEVDGFQIIVVAPAEQKADQAEREKLSAASEEEIPPNKLVNGEVGNFIFSTLQEKTTFLDVRVSESGKEIESQLTDRGELVYHIQEPNPYEELSKSEFRCQLFYLNRSAKTTFARRLGIRSIDFGSVFLFRNDFRVFPVGEAGDDWFGIDRRKQQGYARFLGTRDLIGRIDVRGRTQSFQEASSRNQGLIESPAVTELKRCFRDLCLRRLERYVVPVSWSDKGESDSSDISRLLTDPGSARVARAVATLVDSEQIELINYSSDLIRILDERSEEFEDSLVYIREIASKTKDRNLLRKIDQAESRFEALKQSEAKARKQADEERTAKEAAQAAAETAGAELAEAQTRNLFLTSISSLDTDTILNMHHQITIYAVDLLQQIDNILSRIRKKKQVDSAVVVASLEPLVLLSKKIMSISKFATKANFRLDSEKIKSDLAGYITEYIEEIAAKYISGRTKVAVTNETAGFTVQFKPIDWAIVIDNLVSNSRKAGASSIVFQLSQPKKGVLELLVRDNGRGIEPRLKKNPEQMFEKGVTTTSGSGLGLYHVHRVLSEMGGTIELKDDSSGRGATFLVRVSS